MLRCYRENTLRTDVPYLLIRKMSLTRGTIQIKYIKEVIKHDGTKRESHDLSGQCSHHAA